METPGLVGVSVDPPLVPLSLELSETYVVENGPDVNVDDVVLFAVRIGAHHVAAGYWDERSESQEGLERRVRIITLVTEGGKGVRR